MEVEALRLVAKAAEPSTQRVSGVDSASIEAFNRALYGQASIDTSLIDGFQVRAQNLEAAFDKVMGLGKSQAEMKISGNPEAMLAAQAGMMKASLTVDFCAKLAASASQSINKLVNLQ